MPSSCWSNILFFLVCLLSCPVNSQPYDYPTANISTSWINSVSVNLSVSFPDNSTVTPILLRGTSGPSYACGFYCNGNCQTYMFAIFIVQTNSGGNIISHGFPQVIWSANRDNPVGINATLELTTKGDLVLRDVDGTLAWSTNTSRMLVSGLNLTETGNLVLFDVENSVVWQSFDHPTDVLVPRQILASGKNLTASVSLTNWTRGLYSLSMTSNGLVASILGDPSQVYYEYTYENVKENHEPNYAWFENGEIHFYKNSTQQHLKSIPYAAPTQYTKLGHDGHLRVLEWANYKWDVVSDVFTGYHGFGFGVCNYPTVCGKYGICANGQCSCPSSSLTAPSFREVNDRHPDLGCYEVVPLTCDASSNHSFIDLEDATYFSFTAHISGTDMNRCKEACLKNCSCKAAFFRYGSNSSHGDCYLPSQIFSLMDNDEKGKSRYNSSVSIKVQIAPNVTSPAVPGTGEEKNRLLAPIVGASIGIICFSIVLKLLFREMVDHASFLSNPIASS